MKPEVLTIAGSDPTGGAGIQSDLRTFEHFKVRGRSAVTALTAQNSRGVTGVWPVEAEVVSQQIEALFEDSCPRAVKIGMLCQSDTVKAVARLMNQLPSSVAVVLDPVLISSSGYHLLSEEGVEVLKQELIPRATVLTPNLPEANRLLNINKGEEPSERKLCRLVHSLGAGNVLLKGGHGEGSRSVDFLFDGDKIRSFASPRVEGAEVHGSGCRLSSALAAELAKGGAVEEAVTRAKGYMDEVFREAAKQIIPL